MQETQRCVICFADFHVRRWEWRLFCQLTFHGWKASAADFLGMKELDTKVVILPGISAFVGADIMAGIAKMNMHRSEGYHLLLEYWNEWGDGAWKLPSYVM